MRNRKRRKRASQAPILDGLETFMAELAGELPEAFEKWAKKQGVPTPLLAFHSDPFVVDFKTRNEGSAWNKGLNGWVELGSSKKGGDRDWFKLEGEVRVHNKRTGEGTYLDIAPLRFAPNDFTVDIADRLVDGVTRLASIS